MAESYTSTYAANGAAVDAALAKADTALQPSDVQTNAADRTEGRIARIDLVPVDPFREVCQIAGMEPTLYLDFARQDYRLYNSATGLERKALTDILDSESGDIRNSTGTAFNALGLLEEQAADVPRLEFDPETGLCRGVLVEESRTNLLTYSQEFDNAAWVKSNVTVAANAAVAPDGALTADKLVENTSNNPHSIAKLNVSISSGSTYTQSLFVKAAERYFIFIRLMNSSSGDDYVRCGFNLSSGTADTPVAEGGVTAALASISNVGNGWYKVTLTATVAFTSVNAQIFAASGTSFDSVVYTGDGTSGIYIWGAQLEQGSFPTSYTKTTTAAATRAADTLTISGTRFSDFWNPSEGSFLIDATSANQVSGFQSFAQVSDATTSNRVGLVMNSAGDVTNIEIIVSGSVVASWYPYYAGGRARYSLAIEANNAALATDGAQAVTDTDCTVPVCSQIDIGCMFGGNNQLNGQVGRLAYFHSRLGNSTLQLLSSLGA